MAQYYQLHDLRIRTRSDHPTVERMLRRTLRYKGAEALSSAEEVDITLDFCVDQTVSANLDEAQHLGTTERGGIEVWKAPDRMLLCRDESRVHLLETGQAEATLGSDILSAHVDQRRNPLFYTIVLSFVILLRYRGWYPLHTAALRRDECGVLLVARSESGKSTAALQLVREGWRYLSDDTVLLKPDPSHVQAYSFRRPFCVHPEGAQHFPELCDRQWPPSLSDAEKWQVDLGEVYPGQFTPTCTPQIVVFPEIVDAAQSELEVAETKTALAHLIDQTAFFLTPDPDVASEHLDVLRGLIEQSQVYHLYAGRDVLDESSTLPALLHALL